MLQLHKTEGGQEYAEFLHAPRKRFTDFGKGSLPYLCFAVQQVDLCIQFHLLELVLCKLQSCLNSNE